MLIECERDKSLIRLYARLADLFPEPPMSIPMFPILVLVSNLLTHYSVGLLSAHRVIMFIGILATYFGFRSSLSISFFLHIHM